MNRREAIRLGAGAVVGARRCSIERVIRASLRRADRRSSIPPHLPRPIPAIRCRRSGTANSGSLRRMSCLCARRRARHQRRRRFKRRDHRRRDYLLAIDALQGPVPARNFIAAAKKATGKDVARLVLTHHHGDHVNGNQFFTQAEILSHPRCRSEVPRRSQHTEDVGPTRRRRSMAECWLCHQR